MEERLSPTELRSLWRYYDIDGNGYLEYQEFRELLEAIRKKDGVENPLPDGFLQQCYIFVDQNRNGVVVYKEFMENFNTYWTNRKNILEAFLQSQASTTVTKTTKHFEKRVIMKNRETSGNNENGDNALDMTEDVLNPKPCVRDARTDQLLVEARREITRITDDLTVLKQAHQDCSETISKQELELQESKKSYRRHEEKSSMLETLCKDLEDIRSQLNSELDKEKGLNQKNIRHINELNRTVFQLEGQMSSSLNSHESSMLFLGENIATLSKQIKSIIHSHLPSETNAQKKPDSIDYDALYSSGAIHDHNSTNSRDPNFHLDQLKKHVNEFAKFHQTFETSMTHEYTELVAELEESRKTQELLKDRESKVATAHKKEINHMRTSIERLNADISSERKNHSDTVKSLNASLKEYKEMSLIQRETLRKAQLENHELSTHVKQLQTEISESKRINQKLIIQNQESLSDRDALESNKETLISEKSILNITLSKLEAELRKANSNLEIVTADKNALKERESASFEEVSQTRRDLSLLKSKLVASESDRKKISDENQLLLTEVRSLKENVADLEHAKQKTQILNRNHNISKEELNKKRNEVNELQKELSKTSQQNRLLSGVLDKLKGELRELRLDLNKEKKIWYHELIPNTLAEIREDVQSLEEKTRRSDRLTESMHNTLVSVVDEILRNCDDFVMREFTSDRNLHGSLNHSDIRIMEDFSAVENENGIIDRGLKRAVVNTIRSMFNFFCTSLRNSEGEIGRLQGYNQAIHEGLSSKYVTKCNPQKTTSIDDHRIHSRASRDEMNPEEFISHSIGQNTITVLEESPSVDIQYASNKNVTRNLEEEYRSRNSYTKNQMNRVTPVNSRRISPPRKQDARAELRLIKSIIIKKYGTLSKAFDSIDINRSGQICLVELEQGFRNLGVSIQAIKKVFAAMDRSRDALLTKREFVSSFSVL